MTQLSSVASERFPGLLLRGLRRYLPGGESVFQTVLDSLAPATGAS